MSVDPMADQRNWVSPYNFVQNNPLSRIDPNGMLDDPIFNLKGEQIGDDGKDDGKIHIVTDNNQAKSINGDQVSLEGTSHVTLHGGEQTVEGVENSVEAAASDGIHEEGGHTQVSEDGSVEIVPWKPGPPRIGATNASIPPFNGTEDPGEPLLDNWHVHTSKATYIDTANGPVATSPTLGPSDPGDLDFARGMTARGKTTIQVDTKGKTKVNFINGDGIVATMKYKNFQKLRQ